ncbi:MAG: hypothetical protein WKG07_32675 [Hymenobacter sp.]
MRFYASNANVISAVSTSGVIAAQAMGIITRIQPAPAPLGRRARHGFVSRAHDHACTRAPGGQLYAAPFTFAGPHPPATPASPRPRSAHNKPRILQIRHGRWGP